MFKRLIGKHHKEFSTAHQQDAVEFLQHLLELMTRSERMTNDRIHWMTEEAGRAPGEEEYFKNYFEFEWEDRLECMSSHQVKYLQRKDSMLQVMIPPADIERWSSTSKGYGVVVSSDVYILGPLNIGSFEYLNIRR